MYSLLFCAHTLCMNYVTKMFLLVIYSVQIKQLVFHAQSRPKREQKHTKKKSFRFYNHVPPLTMGFASHYRIWKTANSFE